MHASIFIVFTKSIYVSNMPPQIYEHFVLEEGKYTNSCVHEYK